MLASISIQDFAANSGAAGIIGCAQAVLAKKETKNAQKIALTGDSILRIVGPE